MALISSKLMYFQPILRYSCKAVLRLPTATTALTIPKLESSGFHNYRIINSCLEPASFFSTDSKKPKKKEQADKLNSADQMIFQTESQLKEFGEKLSAESFIQLTYFGITLAIGLIVSSTLYAPAPTNVHAA